MLSQKSFQIDSRFQFVFKTIIQQKSFQSESVSEFRSKSITSQKSFRIDLNFVSFAFVFEIRLISHRNFQTTHSFFDVQSIVLVSDSEVRLIFHKDFQTTHSFFDVQSIVLISDFIF